VCAQNLRTYSKVQFHLLRKNLIMITVLDNHALVQHFLSILRNAETGAEPFRRASEAMTRILILEASKSLELKDIQIQTPLENMTGKTVSEDVVIVPILRAGIGMLQTSLDVIPGASVGFIGLERDEATAIASCYYAKMPEITERSSVFVIDPMLATGGSAIQTVNELKAKGAKKLMMISVICAPEGVEAFVTAHPDVPVITGVIDRELNASKYICPGLGDFGDRLFIT